MELQSRNCSDNHLFLFYRFSGIKQEITFLGTNKIKAALLFPVILFIGYSIHGMNNDNEINKHLWAFFIFCAFMLVYNIMEEYTWRGYLTESLGKINLVIKELFPEFSGQSGIY